MSWFLGWFSNSLSQYNLTESWLSQYQISGLSAEDFFQVNAKTPLPLNVHEIEDQKMLTRYMVQTTDIKDATEEAELVKSSWLGILLFMKLCWYFSFRVSQQVWNTLRNVCERSELRLQKNCILLQKIAFWAFFVNCKKWKWIFKQLCSNFNQFTK